MSAAKRQRLEAVVDIVRRRRLAGMTADTIIAELVKYHGARQKRLAWTNTLRAGGIATWCTASFGHGLLANWERLAARRLMEPHGGYGRE